MNGIDHLLDGVHGDITAAISNVGVIHVVQKHSNLLVIESSLRPVDVVLENQTTPVARVGRSHQWFVSTPIVSSSAEVKITLAFGVPRT